LHGIGGQSCPKCEVLGKEHGVEQQLMYVTWDYMRYRKKALRHEPVEIACIVAHFPQLGIQIGNTVFIGVDRVSPTDLHKLNLLHNIYLD